MAKLTEREIRNFDWRNLEFPPLKLEEWTFGSADGPSSCADGTLKFSWGPQSLSFLVEIKSLGTPKIVAEAAYRAKVLAEEENRYPMVVVPFLSEERLAELERIGVSGLDLCGNGVVILPGQVLVFRTGKPNRYRQSAGIRNVYRGNSSMVPRALVLQRRFASPKELLAFIVQRGGSLGLSTVSKALKALEEDLVIRREGRVIRVIQEERLFDRLEANYRPPKTLQSFLGVSEQDPEEILVRLGTGDERAGAQGYSLTGDSSSAFYLSVGRVPPVCLYTSVSPDEFLETNGIQAKPETAFPNIEIRFVEGSLPFFDSRTRDGLQIASPLQAWLELSAGGKRSKELGREIRRRLLEPEM